MDSLKEKMPISAGASSVQTPSQVGGQIGSSSVASDGGDNGLYRQAKSLHISSKKVEDDIKLLGKKILHHEENIKYLKEIKGSYAYNIAVMEATLAKHRSYSKDTVISQALSQKRRLEETIERIMQHEKSAASVLCHLTRNVAQPSSARNVIGVLATLGHVEDINLSRLLSEYLGKDTMLALVCKSYECIKCLETYDNEGSINKRTGLYRLGACIGKDIDGRFNAISVQNLRPFVGEFMSDDPQRRLVLLEPKLPNGESPAGFLGFAVNMIYIDSENLSYVTNDGNGLRETLFYSLFSRLQVYRTRTDMLQALPLISDGAISLDGGIIRSPGVFTLGSRSKKEIDVNFGIWYGDSFPSKDYTEIEKEVKELKWKSDRMKEDIQREEALLAYEKSNLEVKKKDFFKLAHGMLDPMQHPVQATQVDPTAIHATTNAMGTAETE